MNAKLLSKIIFTILIVSFLYVSVSAQTTDKATQPKKTVPVAGKQRRNLNAIMFASLNLTPDQKARLKTVRQQHQPRIKELRQTLVVQRKALAQAIILQTIDEAAISARADDVAKTLGDLLKANVSLQLAVRQILTPDQTKRLQYLRWFAGQARRSRR